MRKNKITRKELDVIVLDHEEELCRNAYGYWYNFEFSDGFEFLENDYSFMIKEGCLFIANVVPYKDFSYIIKEAF